MDLKLSMFVFLLVQVGAQKSITELDSDLSLISNTSVLQKSLHQDRSSLISESWMTLSEPVGLWSPYNFTVQGILEHLNVTKDSSDYLWYFTRYNFFSIPAAPMTLYSSDCRGLLLIVKKNSGVMHQWYLEIAALTRHASGQLLCDLL